MSILAVIPARGGSKGIPKKNVRMMVGQPLISYSLQNALNSSFDMDICVSSDDDDIKRIARNMNVDIIDRTERLSSDSVTLDPVVNDAVIKMESKKNKKYDVVITLQPTSPLLSVETFDKSISEFLSKDFDTMISGTNSPHLSWKEEDGELRPNYVERLNRQYLPKHLLETGAFVITKREFVNDKSRFGENISIFEVPAKEAIDIDTPQDWWVAEKELSKKNIIIRVDGYSTIGLGHIYRCLTLAENLIDHNFIFVLHKQSDSGIEKIHNSYFPYEVIEDDQEVLALINNYKTDIVINDILNTSLEYIDSLKTTGVKIINFEDLGEGSKIADVVINDLYEPTIEGNHYYWGSDYYLVRDEFLMAKPYTFSPKVQNILIVFGGTDPLNLTSKALKSLKTLTNSTDIKFTVIVGPGYSHFEQLKKDIDVSGLTIEVLQDVKSMSSVMQRTDLAISSQGRTMLELATMNVPSILLAQNERELEHEFGYLHNGFINLGYGRNCKENTILETVEWLVRSPQIREQMQKQMQKKDLKKGLDRVLELILKTN